MEKKRKWSCPSLPPENTWILCSPENKHSQFYCFVYGIMLFLNCHIFFSLHRFYANHPSPYLFIAFCFLISFFFIYCININLFSALSDLFPEGCSAGIINSGQFSLRGPKTFAQDGSASKENTESVFCMDKHMRDLFDKSLKKQHR